MFYNLTAISPNAGNIRLLGFLRPMKSCYSKHGTPTPQQIPSLRCYWLFLKTISCLLLIFFLKNWFGKKLHGQYYHADEQARTLAILLSNRLGEKMYSTVAPMIGLPLARQAQRIRAKDQSSHTYMPGLNDWALEEAASREVRLLQMSMDGTRIVRVIELYLDTYLLGKTFPPDVRLYPNEANHVKACTWEQVQQHVLSVCANKQYAAEAYSFNVVDTSGRLTDIMVGSVPEVQSGVTASHILARN